MRQLMKIVWKILGIGQSGKLCAIIRGEWATTAGYLHMNVACILRSCLCASSKEALRHKIEGIKKNYTKSIAPVSYNKLFEKCVY